MRLANTRSQPTAISLCNPYDKQQNNEILIYVSSRELPPGLDGRLLEWQTNIIGAVKSLQTARSPLNLVELKSRMQISAVVYLCVGCSFVG